MPKRRLSNREAAGPPARREEERTCWLCDRPLGRRVEWHHPKPKSRGGRTTEPVHPICHRTIHATYANHELARMADEEIALRDQPELATFLRFIHGKPPDFHAPTRRRR
ncbi:HNH endonuclease [Fulvimarina endophytica]|uniref:HNH endonuclease n=1 Tax=Fulvimarina endophytica TaxID=2293836 RepID=A0A371X9Y9_9HYPH|nr:HNH endonuclease [Fulvimarina endophytica]RFC66026.1 HNH endonuclease [Fulvimarina endophytica]